ncbi:ribonuclease HI [Microvirga tunisiensis]|uniref:ribonuclease H n=2 Tax=Microvirga tunisiensis TaxID=2108360 RepID=A0A5N7MVS1_9HYPH|nr:ribonuclease HI [Microvirga tunisiensis]MPR31041.1 ribonuclease HI [Microvirga tunisiensis]
MTNEHAEPVIVAYVNGHTVGNPGPGGWGIAALAKNGTFQELSGTALGSVTNNQMELLAAIALFSRLDRRTEVIVYADSQYLIHGMNEYLAKWKQKAWRTSDGKPVKNAEFWILLDRLTSRHRVTWNWVPGQFISPGNDVADRLAQTAANSQQLAA